LPIFVAMPDFPNSTKALFQLIQQRLMQLMDAPEAGQQAYWLLESLYGRSRTDVIMDRPLQLSSKEEEKLEEALKRLEQHEPIQYVLGEAPFYQHVFKVNTAVLIPRPETEELVHHICRRHAKEQGLRLLDIGTGSGCIAISLALCLPGAVVSAVDVSPSALEVAQENARLLGADVQFFETDILEEFPVALSLLDVIVSNPPYVRELEKSLMKPNVMEWEPHTALFVEDADPLLFYRRIAQLAEKLLKEGGWLYFEINEAYGKQVADLLEQKGFMEVKTLKDLQKKDRMVQAKKAKAVSSS
jgi:release factor glutamine methyltransferase